MQMLQDKSSVMISVQEGKRQHIIP